jgi:Zn-dependent peptidase ImmA (M78 family)
MSRATDKANALLQRLNVHAPPIDPELIAASLGIPVDKLPFSPELSGVLVRSPERTAIGINKNHPKKRQRFSIAHELGHYVLEHKGELFVDQTVLNKRDEKSQIAVDPQEIEANAFAANLLMPQHMMLDALVETAGSNNNITRAVLIEQMAKKFNVSNAAMEYRLINLGFIPAA